MESMRQPAVADRFYPGSKQSLKNELSRLFPHEEVKEKIDARAVMVPHAGYVFSGALAARTLAMVHITETVVILGPNHHGYGSPVSLSGIDWAMPNGRVHIDKDFEQALLTDSELIQLDESAHVYEHSLEVQVPFLHALHPDCKIVPLVLGHLSYAHCRTLAKSLADTIRKTGKKVLLVASTDMSHYETRENAEHKDSMALACIAEMNPEKLYQTVHQHGITMCGVIPVVVSLLAAIQGGATQSKLIGYTDSGYVTHDTKQVVGYAGYVIS